MNVLMFDYEYPPWGGGGGVIHQQLAEELGKELGITVITSKFHGQKAREIQGNVEIIRVPVGMRNERNAASLTSMLAFYPSSLYAGYRLLRKRPFDIIHSMFAVPSGVSGLQLARIFHRPHMVSLMGGDVYDPTKRLSPHNTPILHRTVKKILRRSDRVIAMSRDILGRANQHFGPFNRGIEQIPGAIKRPVFHRSSRQNFGYEDDDILLVTVGRLVSRKGLHELIRAVKELERVKLLVIGGGPEKDSLQRLANELQISSRVFLLGNVSEEEKFQLLSLSDIYVSCTRHEGFGLVFLEALACGLPVVCYDNGGQVDFLREGQTGHLVPLGNLQLFVEKVKALCQAPEVRKKMAQYSVRHVEGYYIEACASHYKRLYSSVLEESSMRHRVATDTLGGIPKVSGS